MTTVALSGASEQALRLKASRTKVSSWDVKVGCDCCDFPRPEVAAASKCRTGENSARTPFPDGIRHHG